jgi:hypothetical protein
MVKRLRALLVHRLGPAVFGNTLVVEKNRIWRNFHKSCQQEFNIANPKRHAPSKSAAELKRDRLSILLRTNVEELAIKIDEEFGDSDLVYSEISADNAIKYADLIYTIIKSAEKDVLDFYGSYFQPYWISIQRTTPGKTTAASSFGWHIDDNPREMLKLFVYLNDVGESNGAFRAFPQKDSRRLLLKGFRSNGEITRVAAQPMADMYLRKNPKSLKVLEGPAGTVLAFDNNLVHKGTAPKVGYRHAIQIPIFPSRVPLNLEMVKSALLSSKKRDYPLNPYRNDFGNEMLNQ